MIQHGMPGHPSLPYLRLIKAPHRLQVHNGKPCFRHWYAGLLLDIENPFF